MAKQLQLEELGWEDEIQLEEEKLLGQMEYTRYEHETELMKEQLREWEEEEVEKSKQNTGSFGSSIGKCKYACMISFWIWMFDC